MEENRATSISATEEVQIMFVDRESILCTGSILACKLRYLSECRRSHTFGPCPLVKEKSSSIMGALSAEHACGGSHDKPLAVHCSRFRNDNVKVPFKTVSTMEFEEQSEITTSEADKNKAHRQHQCITTRRPGTDQNPRSPTPPRTPHVKPRDIL